MRRALAAAAAAWDWMVDTTVRQLCIVLWRRHRVIPTSTDPSRPLLEQLAIVRMGRFGALYLQRFCNPELPRFFHRHAWHRVRSFVLSGSFTEERAPLAFEELGTITSLSPSGGSRPITRLRLLGPGTTMRTHRRLSTYTMDRSVIHRTHSWSPRCWTLFWMSSPKLEDWGYYDRDAAWRFIPWREQVAKQVPSLDEPGRLT